MCSETQGFYQAAELDGDDTQDAAQENETTQATIDAISEHIGEFMGLIGTARDKLVDDLARMDTAPAVDVIVNQAVSSVLGVIDDGYYLIPMASDKDDESVDISGGLAGIWNEIND